MIRKEPSKPKRIQKSRAPVPEFGRTQLPPADGGRALRSKTNEFATENSAEAAARYFDHYHFAPVGYCTVNADGLVVEANLAAATLLELPRRDLVEQPFSRFILAADYGIFLNLLERLSETGLPQSCELRMMKRGGDSVWVQLKASSQADAARKTETHCVLGDLTSRRQSEAALLASERLQMAILNSLPAHIAVLNDEGRIVAVNEPWLRFARNNGATEAGKIGVGANYFEACKSACQDGNPHATAAVEGLKLVVTGKHPSFTMEYPCNGPGCPRWFVMEVLRPTENEGGAIVAHTEITEHKHAQQLLAWEKSALELISSAASLHDVLDGLMLSLEKQSPGTLCSVLLLDDDGLHLRHGAAPSLPDAYNRLIDGVAIGPAVGSCGTAAHDNRQVIVADIASDPLWAEYRELAISHGLRACWSTPIHCSKGKILGTFAIYYREPRQPVPVELDLIARAVHITRIAIERKHGEEEIHKLNAELEQRVEERTQELQAANASLTDFKAALDEHAIVAITNANGKITYANDSFCSISKYSREEMIGQDHRIINSGHHPKDFFRDLWQTITSGRVWKGEIRNRAKDGSFYWVKTTIVPFIGQDGKPAQFIAIRTDITERKRAEEEIARLNADLQSRAARLESANKELEAFSYSVSHDLRAPLRAVDGFSRMLIEDCGPQLDDEGRRMLGVIRSETQRMGQLIDDLLAFSRLGRQQIDPASIDMHALAQGVFDELAALAPERRLQLDLRSLPPARGAEPMIRQVWVNLIGNALKFTQAREVAEIEIGPQETADGEPIYYVKDNGAGFDMRYADKLFGVFQRLHTQQEFPGTGLGLALVQRIVQRHGGRVWAEAEVDRGATFYFSIPNPN